MYPNTLLAYNFCTLALKFTPRSGSKIKTIRPFRTSLCPELHHSKCNFVLHYLDGKRRLHVKIQMFFSLRTKNSQIPWGRQTARPPGLWLLLYSRDCKLSSCCCRRRSDWSPKSPWSHWSQFARLQTAAGKGSKDLVEWNSTATPPNQ